MSDITVYLTTTKWTIATDHPNHDFFVKKDVPVCCAAMIIASFGFSPHELETIEFRWAKIMKEMAKLVLIDSNKKTVYIGEESENSGLIEYTEQTGSEYSKHFFERWDQTQTLMLEFIIYDKNNKPITCLKGLWDINHWDYLDFFPTNNIQIVSPSHNSK